MARRMLPTLAPSQINTAHSTIFGIYGLTEATPPIRKPVRRHGDGLGPGETLISSTALECQNLAAGSVKVDQTPAIHLDCMAIHLPREHLHRPLALPRLIHKSLESTTRPATPQERKPVSTGDLPPGMCFRCRDHLTWILPAWTSLILQVAADKGMARLMQVPLRPIRWMISRQTESDGQIHRRKIRSQTSKFTEWADPECWAPRETVW